MNDKYSGRKARTAGRGQPEGGVRAARAAFVLLACVVINQAGADPGYPGPRYPAEAFQENLPAEQWLSWARLYVKGQRYQEARYRPEGIEYVQRLPEKGDVILIITDAAQNSDLMEAIIQVMRADYGVAKVDVMIMEDLLRVAGYDVPETPQPTTAEEGWKEYIVLESGFGGGSNRLPDLEIVKGFLRKHPEYTKFYGPGAGGNPRAMMSEFGERWGGYFYARDLTYLLYAIYPEDVGVLVDQKLIELLLNASEIRIFDPQGTDISWAQSPEDRAYMAESYEHNAAHLFLFPSQATSYYGERLVVPKVEGVIKGTANHYGYYPAIGVYLENGVISRIEGGGRYGEIWRAFLERTKDVQYPGMPGPGLFYPYEMGLGTMPKAVRATGVFETYGGSPNSKERNRAGVIHFGFGIEVMQEHAWSEKLARFGEDNGVPARHWMHIHVYFPTVQLKMADTGKWINIVDKGWITLFDDPEVRALASKYGDTDEFFDYLWYPAIPGINFPGDYMQDYGNDPVSWIKKEFELYRSLLAEEE